MMPDSEDSKAANHTRKSNPHSGHRKRVRQRYIKSGLSDFEDHEALEMLLFYSVPMRDTNNIAHNMLNEMGSLHTLMDASVQDIMRVCKCGETTAVLISLIPAMYKKYELSKWQTKTKFGNSRAAAAYAKNLFIGEKVECFYLICLDNQGGLIFSELLTRGTANEVHFYSKDIVSCALKHNASAVIIAHNHPSGYLKASPEDEAATVAIESALTTIGVDVIDHIIIAGDKYMSFSEKKLYRFGEGYTIGK